MPRFTETSRLKSLFFFFLVALALVQTPYFHLDLRFAFCFIAFPYNFTNKEAADGGKPKPVSMIPV